MAGITLKRTLSLWQVTALGLAWNTPMIYFSTFGISYESASGQLFLTYALSFFAILFTGISYAYLAKKMPISGSAYTFAKAALHPNAGFFVGWIVLLNYLFAPIIACITFGVFLHAQFPTIPPFVWIIGLIVLLAAIAIKGIDASANISALFVSLQLLFIGFFAAFLVIKLFQNGAPPFAQAFSEPLIALDDPAYALLVGTSVVIFSFLGFDTITTLSEETKNPVKTIPRAIYLILAIVGCFHLTSSFIIQFSFPALSFLNVDSAALELMAAVGGHTLQIVFMAVLAMAIFTQGLASMTAASRLMYAMGRDGLLPKSLFAYLHHSYKTPVYNILFASCVSLIALLLPIDSAMRFVNFGALSSFFFVNLCVIALIWKNKQPNVLSSFLACAGALTMFTLIASLDTLTLTVGFCWIGFGFAYLLYLTKAFQKPLAPWQPLPKETIRAS
ncbi:APC family permease [Shouchella clausii]|uniref:APC family permease n=1 Tax=Shouchella clausii TaxID=79880 RepID=UPI002DBC152E|nr:APC family permease [Shouchella clausii]MEB5479861.1 APC family permease [Shouchella clausii]